MDDFLRIGELAAQTGLSTRTLRYYDEIGLLTPSKHSESRYRLYQKADVIRLQQIVSLKELGFPLGKIGELIDDCAYSVEAVVDLHLAQVREHIALQQELAQRLEAVAEALKQRNNVSSAELLRMIEVISLAQQHGFDPNFSQGALDKIKQQGEKYGPDTIRKVEQEWPELIQRLRDEMEQGTPTNDPAVQVLMSRWQELVDMFTGGDPEISRKLADAYERAPDFSASMGMDAELMEYVNLAMSGTSSSES